MKTKAQEWFLVKKNWMEWIEDLSMEQRGEFFTALYTSQLPEGLLGILVKSHMEEFARVNENREEGLAKRREASKKGNEVKYQSTPSGNLEGVDSTPSLSRTKTKTKTSTEIETNIDLGIEISSNNLPISRSQKQSIDMFDEMFADL